MPLSTSVKETSIYINFDFNVLLANLFPSIVSRSRNAIITGIEVIMISLGRHNTFGSFIYIMIYLKMLEPG